MSIVGIRPFAIPREQQAAHCLPVLFDPPTHPFRARADSETGRLSPRRRWGFLHDVLMRMELHTWTICGARATAR